MATLKLSAPNPIDGTTTFNKVIFVYADDTSGTNKTDIATVTIDTSDRTPLNVGNTSYIYTSATLTKYFAAEYYNSVSLVRTTATASDYVLGGKDRWDSMFENEMSDTSNAVWSQNDLARFKAFALDALFPELHRVVIDTTLTIDSTAGAEVYTYTVPFGIFEISEIGIGDINNITTNFKVVNPDNWKFERNLIHFTSLAGYDNGEAIRIVGAKKFMDVGEVPERYDEIALSHLKMSAYLNMADDFPRFLTWGQLQEGTKVSFENLRVHAREFERKFKALKSEQAELLNSSLY